MADSAPIWHIGYYALVLDSQAEKILLLREGETWSLPHWQTRDTPPYWQDAAPVYSQIEARWSLRTQVLYMLHASPFVREGEVNSYDRIYVVQNLDPQWQPPADSAWVDHTSAAALDIAIYGEQISAFFSDDPTRRVPWHRPDWHLEVKTWIERQVTDPQLEQLRFWARAAIWKIHSADDPLYFKAAPIIFAHEPALTAFLAQHHPDTVPAVPALDPERGWFLLANGGTASLRDCPDIARWELALSAYAKMQIDLCEQWEALNALGCPDERVEYLARQIDPLFDAEDLLLAQDCDKEEIAAFKTLRPELKSLCADLAHGPVPHTLEHGDFHFHQILIEQSATRFIDWSDSAWSHPFFSWYFFWFHLAWMLEENVDETARTLNADPDLEARLRHAYLAPWTDYAPLATLDDLCAKAGRLAPLYYGLKYRRFISYDLEISVEMGTGMGFYLKKLL